MAHQGFLYESNLQKHLSQLIGKDRVDQGNAGASHDRPDLLISLNPKQKKMYGVELKLSPTAAGSLVVKYDDRTKKWVFDDAAIKGNEEKEFIAALAKEQGILQEINKKWPAPLKRWNTPPGYEKASGWDKMSPKQRYQKDYASHPDIKKDISATAIAKYYNKKNTHYIQVATHGFYLLDDDPAQLNRNLNSSGLEAIPKFSSSAACYFRARCQDKSGNYVFSVALYFKNVRKSPYNLGETKSTGDVGIKTKSSVAPFLF